LFLQGLHILDFYHQHISRLGIFNLKGTAEVVDFGQVDVFDVVCVVGVFDLAACPIYAFDFYDFAVGDFAG
jgi:hypothetical protein